MSKTYMVSQVVAYDMYFIIQLKGIQITLYFLAFLKRSDQFSILVMYTKDPPNIQFFNGAVMLVRRRHRRFPWASFS